MKLITVSIRLTEKQIKAIDKIKAEKQWSRAKVVEDLLCQIIKQK